MSATGLDVVDKTLQITHTWLNEIGEVIGPDKQRCYRALRAVLCALRDRLTVEEAAHLGAQLPMLVRGIYYDGYEPAGKPLRVRSEAESPDSTRCWQAAMRRTGPISSRGDPGRARRRWALSSCSRACAPASPASTSRCPKASESSRPSQSGTAGLSTGSRSTSSFRPS